MGKYEYPHRKTMLFLSLSSSLFLILGLYLFYYDSKPNFVYYMFYGVYFIIFIPITTSCIRTYIRRCCSIVIDDDSILCDGRKKKIRIYYSEISRIEHDLSDDSLIILAGNKKMQIEKKISNFKELYRQLSKNLPANVSPEYDKLPLKINANKYSKYMFVGTLILLGVFTIILGFEIKKPFALLICGGAGIMLIIICIPVWIFGPVKYIIGKDKLTKIFPHHKKIYHMNKLEKIWIEKGTDVDYLHELDSLCFLFDKNRLVVFNKGHVEYPMEHLYEIIKINFPEKFIEMR